jgi:hypothetical protein
MAPALKVIGIASAVTAIAAFLPWASVLGVSALGIQGDGVITLIAALLGLVLLAGYLGYGPLHPGRRVFGGIEIALAAVVAITGLADLTNFAAIGIYLTLFGGIAWGIAAAVSLRRVKQTG